MTRQSFEPGPTNRAFLLLIAAILWVFIVPVFAVVGLFTRRRTDAALQDAGHECSDLVSQNPVVPLVNILHDGDTSI